MNVYFHIDELARDAIVASSLKKHFKGHNLIYGNRFSTNFLLPKFYHLFDYVIVPRSSFLKPNNKIKKTKVIVLPTEAIGKLNSSDKYIFYNTFGEKFMSGDNSEDEFVFSYFLWGKQQLDAIIKKYPKISSRLHVVGHPRLDQTFSKKSTSKKNKIQIGLVSRMTHANSYDNRSIIEHLKIYKNEKYLYKKDQSNFLLNPMHDFFKDYLYLEISDFITQKNIINKLIEQENIEIYFKVHPREDISVWKDVFSSESRSDKFFLTPWQTPLVQWCLNLDYIISPSSTSFYEALSLKCKIICTDNIDNLRNQHDKVEELIKNGPSKFLYKPSNIDEILKIVNSNSNNLILDQKNVSECLKNEINYPKCFHSSKFIFEFISKDFFKTNKSSKSLWRYKFSEFLLNSSILIKRFLSGTLESQSNNFVLSKKTKNYINNLTTFD